MNLRCGENDARRTIARTIRKYTHLTRRFCSPHKKRYKKARSKKPDKKREDVYVFSLLPDLKNVRSGAPFKS